MTVPVTPAPTRAEVRAAGRAARRSLNGAERRRAEAQLIDHVRAIEAMRAQSVGLFIAHDGEPDLQPLIESLWKSGQIAALPVLHDDPTDFSMRFVPWSPGSSLVEGRYGIPVPPAGAPPVVPDTIVVSLTGFDRHGNRIGRGGGFFDRYLATYSGTAIGVGFEIQRLAQVPTEPHDQQLTTIATDLGVRFII